MRSVVRLAARLVVTLALGIAGLSTDPAAASAMPLDRPADRLDAAAPVDETGITFRAFRSYDLPIVPGQPFYLSVRKWVASGPLHFAELVDDVAVPLPEPTCGPGGPYNGNETVICDLLLSDIAAGSHTYQAVFEATPEWDALALSITVDALPVATTVNVETALNPVQTHQSVTLHAWLSGVGTGVARSGTIEWRNPDTNALLATRTVDDAALTFSSLAIGTHRFVAKYLGDQAHAASTSQVFTLTVVADQVAATGVGLEYTTFYPVTDGYRDSVAIRGLRQEAISVSIRVYNAAGSTVRSTTFARAAGSYSYRWNGRNSAGTVLTAGQYKVVQTLTDAFGTKKTFTNYVTLSRKKLVTYTKYVEKAGNLVNAKGSGSGGAVSTSSTSGLVKLSAGSSGWALAGWEFTIPSATVYKSVTFQVYAKGRLWAGPGNRIGMQHFLRCPRTTGTWYDTCFDGWRSVGNSAGTVAWYSSSTITSSSYRSGRYARGIIDVSAGTVYVYKARVKVIYQVLQ